MQSGVGGGLVLRGRDGVVWHGLGGEAALLGGEEAARFLGLLGLGLGLLGAELDAAGAVVAVWECSVLAVC